MIDPQDLRLFRLAQTHPKLARRIARQLTPPVWCENFRHLLDLKQRNRLALQGKSCPHCRKESSRAGD